jgi:NhaP-type Na+/H+ or K+/H+ antiporter
MTAIIMKHVLPYGWSWPQSFLFGDIVAATDLLAAVALKQVCTCCHHMEHHLHYELGLYYRFMIPGAKPASLHDHCV